jgi:ankyrin repeat protein
MQGDPYKDAYTMYNAIKEGNLQLVRELINGGINIDYPERNSEYTPLLTACRYNKLDIFNELLIHNPDLNHRGYHGVTALMLAAQNNNLIMVRELLNRGVDINAQGGFGGFTALHTALLKPSENPIEVVRELLNRGADKNIVDAYGETPEMYLENTNLDDIKALFHPAPPPDEPSLTAKLETKDDTGEEKACGVCRDDYTNGQTLYLLNPCNHVFHQDCLKSWTDTGRNTCPSCQVHIVNKRELILSEKDEDKYTGPDIFLGGYSQKLKKYLNKLSYIKSS